MSLGLYGPAMHDYIIDECELGRRVAMGLDSEAAGWSALNDWQYRIYEQGIEK